MNANDRQAGNNVAGALTQGVTEGALRSVILESPMKGRPPAMPCHQA